jgi:hypothetical protein
LAVIPELVVVLGASKDGIRVVKSSVELFPKKTGMKKNDCAGVEDHISPKMPFREIRTDTFSRKSKSSTGDDTHDHGA